MTPEERDVVFGRLLAAWPVPRMKDDTKGVWLDHLLPMDHTTVVKALAGLERTSKHRPTLADLHEACGTQRPKRTEPSHVAPECGVCEDGWVQTRCSVCDCGEEFHREDRCMRGPGTSARCPNGCVPKTFEEREAWLRRTEDVWRRDRDQRAERVRVPDLRVDGVRDPSAPNRDQEPF